MKQCTTKRPGEPGEDLSINALDTLFKVYTALILIAEFATSRIVIKHFPGFSADLGYTSAETKGILHDLEKLGLVAVSMKNNRSGTITLIASDRLFAREEGFPRTDLFHTPGLREVPVRILPPLLKTYAELKKRGGLCDGNGPLVVLIKEMAQSLGWSICDLKFALIGLANYHIIDHQKNDTGDEWTISFFAR